MPHTIKGKKQLLTRVRRIKGQSEALERALEKETDCSAILQQIAAIRGAVNGLIILAPKVLRRSSVAKIWNNS